MKHLKSTSLLTRFGAIMAIAMLASFAAPAANAALALYWNFNDSGVANGQPPSALALQSDLTAVPPPTQTSTISLAGFNNGTGVTMAAGTSTENLAPGDATGAGQSLSFSAAVANNGKFFDFTLNGSTLQNLILTEAVRSTSTGFGGITLSYSINGGAFTPFGTDSITRDGSFHTLTFDLSAISALDGQTSITIRQTFNTVTGSTGGNTNIDNIQLTGDAFAPIPEPATVLGGALAVAALGFHQRRRLLGKLKFA